MAWCTLIVFSAVVLGGEEEQKGPSTEEINALVKDLDAPEFKKRQAAHDKLKDLGRPVVPHLAAAAVGDSLEVTLRSIEILKGLLASPDEGTKRAAREALEKMVSSDNPAAAWRAQSALDPEPQKKPGLGGGATVLGGPGIVLGGAGAQASVQSIIVGGAAGMKSVSISNVNGVREINAQENGATIRITDDPNEGITVKITTTEAQEAATTSYKAKNAAELKKNHPEAYTYYQEYAGNHQGAAIVQMHMENRGFAGRRFRINAIIRDLNQLATRLASPATRADLNAAAPRATEQLLEKIQRLKRELDLLEKRLRGPAAKPAAPAAAPKKTEEAPVKKPK